MTGKRRPENRVARGGDWDDRRRAEWNRLAVAIDTALNETLFDVDVGDTDIQLGIRVRDLFALRDALSAALHADQALRDSAVWHERARRARGAADARERAKILLPGFAKRQGTRPKYNWRRVLTDYRLLLERYQPGEAVIRLAARHGFPNPKACLKQLEGKILELPKAERPPCPNVTTLDRFMDSVPRK